MVALGLGKSKPAGEAGAYAKRLADGGHGTAHELAELDATGLGLAGAGMRKGDADRGSELLMRPGPGTQRPLREKIGKRKNGEGSAVVVLAAWPILMGLTARGALPTRCRWWRRMQSQRQRQVPRLM